MRKYFAIKSFKGTCSSVKNLKGYILICWNAAEVHAHLSEYWRGTCKKKVGNPCFTHWHKTCCHAQLLSTSAGIVPYCRNCSVGWMGSACQTPCGPDHGRQVPMDSGVCQCDPCYHGTSCDVLCGGRGTCSSGKNPMCDCSDGVGFNAGWWGVYCNQANCPGMGN